ncbi:MAG: hypothetical protein U5J64_12155 [Halobacteriales archaeon]|nr:hypothetical protein [Halobacteriales archaeon]
MTDSLRENGPVVLVPSAWAVVGAARIGTVSERTLLIAHIVMATVLLLFAVVSWNEMKEGVLRAWRAVLVAGFFITSAGALGLYGVPYTRALLSVALYGWMLVPGVGLAYTARESEAPYATYASAIGALLSLIGAVVYALSSTGVVPVPPTAGIAVVGVGQTVGIADAVYRY